MALATSRHSGGCGRNLTENGGYSEKIPLPCDPKCVKTRCAAARKPAGAWQDICRLILLTIPNSSMLIFDPQVHNISLNSKCNPAWKRCRLFGHSASVLRRILLRWNGSDQQNRYQKAKQRAYMPGLNGTYSTSGLTLSSTQGYTTKPTANGSAVICS